MAKEEIYAQAKVDRQKYVDAVLQSKATKKIIVAGPGTGKTFLFKEMLKGKKSALTLTFVNSLVADLSLELYGLSEVRTLHGFARGVMARAAGSARIFPKLSLIIKEDAEVLLAEVINFDHLFYDLSGSEKHIGFYIRQHRRRARDPLDRTARRDLMVATGYQQRPSLLYTLSIRLETLAGPSTPQE